MEEWRLIEGYDNYMISNYGNIKNITTEKILNPTKNQAGYLRICLYKKDEKKKTFKIHQLVARTFLTNIDNKKSIDHIDNNKINNNVNNLRYATIEENARNTLKKKQTTSKYKGVCFDNHANKWKAYIFNNKKIIHLGYYDDEDEAGIIYNEKAKELYGEYANLNITNIYQNWRK